MRFEGYADTYVFNLWIEKFLVSNLEPGLTVILDNASFHKSLRTIELIEGAGCRVLFLPPYSPDLNPIENIWAAIKAQVKKVLPIFDKDIYSSIDYAVNQY